MEKLIDTIAELKVIGIQLMVTSGPVRADFVETKLQPQYEDSININDILCRRNSIEK